MSERRWLCVALVAAALIALGELPALVAQSVSVMQVEGSTYAGEWVVDIPVENGAIVDPEIVSVSSLSGFCVKSPVFESGLLDRCRDDDGCVLRMLPREQSGASIQPFPKLAATLAFDTEGRWKSLATPSRGVLDSRLGQIDNETEETILSVATLVGTCILTDDHLFQGPVFSSRTFALEACGDPDDLFLVEVACTLRIDD